MPKLDDRNAPPRAHRGNRCRKCSARTMFVNSLCTACEVSEGEVAAAIVRAAEMVFGEGSVLVPHRNGAVTRAILFLFRRDTMLSMPQQAAILGQPNYTTLLWHRRMLDERIKIHQPIIALIEDQLQKMRESSDLPATTAPVKAKARKKRASKAS